MRLNQIARLGALPALAGLTFAVSAAPPLPAQGEGARLRKSDLVRYLTGSAYSKGEIAGIVLRNCLAFVPSARDRQDLRSLGASDAVFRAIDRCVKAHNDPAAVAKATPAPPAQPVVLQASTPTISAAAGTVAYLSATVTRGSSPLPGIRLALRGATRIPGGAQTDPVATTDNAGVATFVIPSGTDIGQYRVSIEATHDIAVEPQFVTVTTTPAAPSRAALTPTVLSIAPAMPPAWTLDATITDDFGNPVPSLGVTLTSPARTRQAPLTRQTNDRGVARFSIPATGFRDGDTLALSAGTKVLARLPVSASAQVAAQMADAERLAATRQATALAVYDSVLAIDPDNAAAHVGRGYLNSRAGRYEEAQKDFQAALRPGGDSVAALTGFGFAALRVGDYQAAEARFASALTLSPGDGPAATGQAYTALWRRDREQAARRAESLENPKPTSYPASAADRFRAGVLLLSTRRFAEAVNAFTAAITTAPGWPEAYYNRALALQGGGQPDRAADDYRRYLQLRPDAANAQQIASRIEALGRTPGKAFALGALIPGMGQFYSRQPAFGALILAGTAAGAVWALKQTSTVELQTFKDPFGNSYTQPVTVNKRKNLAAGAAAGGAVWLIGAIAAAIHTGNVRNAVDIPTSSNASTSAERTALEPSVAIGPLGPEIGIHLRFGFR